MGKKLILLFKPHSLWHFALGTSPTKGNQKGSFKENCAWIPNLPVKEERSAHSSLGVKNIVADYWSDVDVVHPTNTYMRELRPQNGYTGRWYETHGARGGARCRAKGVKSTDLAGVKGVLMAAGLVLPGRLLQRSKVPILLPPGSSTLHQSPGFLPHHMISSFLLQPSWYHPSRCDTISCCLHFSTSRAVDSISFPASGVFLQ